MMISVLPPSEIIARTARDVHPPLYYLVLHFWMNLFGTGELAARSLSMIFGLGLIVLTYFTVRRIFENRTATLASFFVALSPFLVRYSQEARMYEMVAFLTLLGTYFLIRAFQEGKNQWWMLYAVTMALSMYTHYYAAFLIVVHVIYALLKTDFRAYRHAAYPKLGLLDKKWWAANIFTILLFLPWVPVAYAQFSRVQSGFWIPPVNLRTIPATIFQFLSFKSGDTLPLFIHISVIALIVYLTWRLIRSVPQKRAEILLIFLYGFLPLLIIWTISLKRAVYQDRYFPFAAVGFYILLAILLTQDYLKNKAFAKRWMQIWLAVVTLMMLGGVNHVYNTSNHQMRQVAEQVNNNFKPGDGLVAGELYVYFDFSYYNKTGAGLKLLSEGPLTGYGETSLLYDRQSDIRVQDLADVKSTTGNVWVVGKTGEKDYYTNIPQGWQQVLAVESGYVKVVKFATR